MKSLLFILGTILVQTCSKQSAAGVEFRGLLEKRGITTYQYGTHVISDTKKTYALRSELVVLDAYVGKTVTVKGVKIPGYPVDGGPEFLEVSEVQP